MLSTRPATEGMIANAAVGGAVAATLTRQAEQALDDVPLPELAIIQTIDNDIRCDGTDEEHAAELRESVLEALQTISARSPDTKILLVSQVGRPLPHAQMRYDAGTNWEGGDGACDFFDATGAVVPAKAEHLTRIIEGYEAAQLSACAEVPTCYPDNGSGSSFVETWAYMEGADNIHFNAVGLAALAEHMWPTIEQVLGQ
jgi:lysophospholipase L1-like esterase